jgi:CRISPR-associated protein Cmr5
MAQTAFPCIQDRKGALREKAFDEYKSFAKKFPALIHTCGLAQAVAFALAKQERQYVEDLAMVLRESGHPEITSVQMLHEQTRTQQLSGYLRLSRDAINAAGWLKRYVEAAGEE